MATQSLEGLYSLAYVASQVSGQTVIDHSSKKQSHGIMLPSVHPLVEDWHSSNHVPRFQSQAVDLPSFRDMLATIKHDSGQVRQKMALDFIAPPLSDGGSTSSSSSTPKQREGFSQSPPPSSSASLYSSSTRFFPSPVWSASSILDVVDLPKASHPQSYSITSNESSLPVSPPLSPPAEYVSTRHHPTGPREDRHPYDDDERYALLYLRTVQNQKWEAVVAKFRELFPPKAPRRCSNPSARSCPSLYVRRCVQGLQCRFYRIREEERLKPLRDSRSTAASSDNGKKSDDEGNKFNPPAGGWKREKDILDRMERDGRVHPDIVRACKETGKKKGPKL